MRGTASSRSTVSRQGKSTRQEACPFAVRAVTVQPSGVAAWMRETQ